MTQAVLPFPVVPGKTEADIRKIAEHFKAEPQAWRESRSRGKVTMERAYWQHTPMGDFVAYLLNTLPPQHRRGARRRRSGTSDMDRYFAETVKEVHGVDISQPPERRPLGFSVSGEIPRQRAGERALPSRSPASPEKKTRPCAQVKEAVLSDGMTESRRALGETLEVIMLHHTPMGPVVAVYLEGENPAEANRKFAASQEPFDVWFKDKCKEVVPPFIDFNDPVPESSRFSTRSSSRRKSVRSTAPGQSPGAVLTHEGRRYSVGAILDERSYRASTVWNSIAHKLENSTNCARMSCMNGTAGL